MTNKNYIIVSLNNGIHYWISGTGWTDDYLLATRYPTLSVESRHGGAVIEDVGNPLSLFNVIYYDKSVSRLLDSSIYAGNEEQAMEFALQTSAYKKEIYSVVSSPICIVYEDRTNINWIVRLVRPSETYGNLVVNDSHDSLILFYDSRYKHTPYGQFVSSYCAQTLMNHTDGLCLDGGEPKWVLSSISMNQVKRWLNSELN
jgi:hypothetical protein